MAVKFKIKTKIHKVINHSDPESSISDVESLRSSLQKTVDSQRCLVIDSVTGTHDYRLLSPSIIPEKSIPVNENGDPVHYLCFDGKKLEPLNYFPVENDNKTPSDCFRAQWWEGLRVILAFHNQAIEKIKLGIFVGLAVALIFILFIIGAQAMGGNNVVS